MPRTPNDSRGHSPTKRFAWPAPLDPPDDRPTSDPDAFRPRFCPHPACAAHTRRDRFRWHRFGSYTRKAAPHRIPRFRCLVCERTFSTQTFSTTYYLKRPELLAPVARVLTNGACDRHARRTAPGNDHYAPHRDVGAAASTVTRLTARLARHAMLVLAELAPRIDSDEPLELDDFETFAQTQLCAVSVPTIVGHRSGYVHMLDVAAHRRGGTLTPLQRRAEQRLRDAGRLPDPAAPGRAWKRALAAVLAHRGHQTPVPLLSDASPCIARAVRSHPDADRLRLVPHANPPRRKKHGPRTAAARRRDRALREVDLLHRWLRHSTAHDRRETIAFARSVNALLGRRLLFALARNVLQPRRERRRHEGTPAMILGLLPRPLGWDELLERRRFLALSPPLPPGWASAYFETIPTLGTPPSPRRLPRCHRN